MEFRVLGPLEVLRDGDRIEISAPQQRALLALLLLRANAVVSMDELLESLWGGQAPRTAKAALQNAVSGLRKRLGNDVIETVPPGYCVRAAAEQLDLLRFEALLAEARTDDPEARASKLREALSYWRGAPLVDYQFAESEIVRLEELRMLALEDRIDADLALRRHAELVPELDALVKEHPLRERLWGLLMLALYRSGRQAEALATYRRAHEAFVSGLGIEPGPSLRNLQRAVLVQDRSLEHDANGAGLLERAAVFLPTDEVGRAKALYDYGIALWRIGERTHAKTSLAEAERRAAAAGDRVLEERARLQRAAHALQDGTIDLVEYARRAERAAALFRQAGDDASLADALLKQGQALRDSGHADEAVTLHEQGLAAALAAGDRWQEGFARNFLGLALMLGTTPVPQAVARCERELTALEWGTPGPLGLWMSLGMLYAQLGRFDTSRDVFARARASCRDAGAVSTLATVFYFAGWAAQIEGGFEQAEEDHRFAFELVGSLRDLGPRSAMAANVALALAQRERFDEAERFIVIARTASEHDGPATHVAWRRALARIEQSRDCGDQAQQLLTEATALTSTTDWLTFHGETLEDAGDYASALAVFERKGNLVGAARVRQRLVNPSV